MNLFNIQLDELTNVFLRFARHQIFQFIIISVVCVGFTVVVQPYGSIYTKNTWIYQESGT